MTRNKLITVLVAVLILLAIVLKVRQSFDSKIDSDYFSIKDTTNITRITIQKGDEMIFLVKSESKWTIQDSLKVRQQNISDALNILKNIIVKKPIKGLEKDSILKSLQSNGVQISCYSGNKLIKEFVLGDVNPVLKATSILDKKKRQLAAVYVPGMTIALRNYFPISKSAWHERILFNLKFGSISAVSIEYTGNPSRSFLLKKETSTFEVYGLDKKKITNSKKESIDRYLSYFEGIEYKSVLEKNSKQTDSILKTESFCNLNLVDLKGKNYSFRIFKKKAHNLVDDFGMPIPYDVNELYLQKLPDNKIYLITWYSFDPIIKELQYFE